MKMIIGLMFATLALNAYAGTAKKAAPNLAGQCKVKAAAAAQKVVVIDEDVEFADSDIEADVEAKNVYAFNYSDSGGDICYFRAYVTIKPTKVDKKKNQVTDCEIVEAIDDGEPNCG